MKALFNPVSSEGIQVGLALKTKETPSQNNHFLAFETISQTHRIFSKKAQTQQRPKSLVQQFYVTRKSCARSHNNFSIVSAFVANNELAARFLGLLEKIYATFADETRRRIVTSNYYKMQRDRNYFNPSIDNDKSSTARNRHVPLSKSLISPKCFQSAFAILKEFFMSERKKLDKSVSGLRQSSAETAWNRLFQDVRLRNSRRFGTLLKL